MNKSISDDEVVISIEIPKKYNKHTFSLGKALVSHFAYFTQRKVLDASDLLISYHNLTNLYFK